MKVSYVEGLANHNAPESCGAAREGGDEALTGERTGWVYSRVRNSLRDADAVRRSGRLHLRAPISRGALGSCAVTDPEHVPKHLAWEPGDPAFTPDGTMPRDASGSLRTHADDERTREVGQICST